MNSNIQTIPTPVIWTGFDPDAKDFFRRIIANGGTISGPSKTAVDIAVSDLKRKGLWNKIYDCGLFVGNQLAAALVKLKYPAGVQSVLTNVNFVSGNYSEATGLTPDGATKYLNTGASPSLLGLTINSNHLAFYSRTNNVGTQSEMGLLGGGNAWVMWISYNAAGENAGYYSMAAAGRLNTDALPPTSLGLFVGSRTAANAIAIYQAGVALKTGSVAAAGAVSALPIWISALNNNSSPSNYSSKIVAFYSMGLGLSAVEVSDLNAVVNALQTRLGRNV